MSRPDPERTAETVWAEVRDDRLCDRFEFLLRGGHSLLVADFLRGEGIDPDAASPELLGELNRLDAYYRPGDQTKPDANHRADAGEGEVAAGLVLDGRFTLVRLLGRGGMGEVWEAAQTEPVRRCVALKLIKRGMDSRGVLARFAAERQALAVMDHTHIAKVFDAGCTPTGRPYFVMELVDGVPITEFADAGRLTPEQRLELFVPVCQAIQHAHMKGVIHRDIKPSNVLVTVMDGRPVPKVIDFGVAKAVGEPLTEGTFATGRGSIVGTLPYMSPEQAGLNNQDIDTRSDVYSLGVLLYELLTGSTPLDGRELRRAMIDEALRMVREVDAPRPSDKLSTADTLPSLAACRGTEPKKLTGLLRSELDWVVLKALEKDRCRRYDNPLAFAADVQRHLNHEMVEARPPTPGYRLRKFIRRNKGPVLAATAVFVTLLAGVLGTTLGLIEAKRGRDDALDAQGKEATQRGIAEANERTAQANADLAYDRLYKSEIRLLGSLWDDRQFDPARESLARLTPENTGGRDLRRFEWHLWAQRLANPVRTIPVPPPDIRYTIALRVSQDGARCYALRTGMTDSKRSPVLLTLDAITGDISDSWTVDPATTTDGVATDISPNGSRLVVVSSTGQLSVWNTEKKTKRFEVQSTRYGNARFDPTGRRLFTSGVDGTPIIRDAETGREIVRFPGHTPIGSHAQFNADGTRIVLACRPPDNDTGKLIKVFDTATGEVVFSPTSAGGCNGLAFRPDGRQIAVLQYPPNTPIDDKPVATELTIWNLNSPKPLVCPTPGFWPRTLCYSPDSSKLFASGQATHPTPQPQLRVWDTTTGIEQVFALKGQNECSVWPMTFTPDGRHLLIQSEFLRIQVWDVSRVQGERVLPFDFGLYGPRCLAVTPDGGWLASAGDRLVVCDLNNYPRGRVLTDQLTYAVAFDPRGGRLFSVGATGRRGKYAVTVWGMPGGERKTGWEVELSAPGEDRFRLGTHASLAVSADGNQLAVTLPDRSVRVWKVATQEQTHQFAAPPSMNMLVGQTEFSPDGKTLAAQLGDLCVWDLHDKSQVSQFGENAGVYTGLARGFAYLDDRRLLVSERQRLRVVDVFSGAELLTVPGFGGQVQELRVLPGGDRVVGLCEGDNVAGGHFPSLRVWETTGWSELLRVNLPDRRHASIAVSRDGRQLAVGGLERICLYDTSDPDRPKVVTPAPSGDERPLVAVVSRPTDYAGWARYYRSRVLYKEAADAYRKAVPLDPQNASLRLELAPLLRVRNDADGAIAAYREGLRLSPQEFDGWCELGLLLQIRNDHRGAADALRTAVKHDTRPPDIGWVSDGLVAVPPPFELLEALGVSLNHLGSHEEAEAVFRRAARLLDGKKHFYTPTSVPGVPDVVRVGSGLATCLLRQKKWQEVDTECGKLLDQALSLALDRAFVPAISRSSTDADAGPRDNLNRSSAEQVITATTKIASELLWANRLTGAVEWSDRAIGYLSSYSKKWPGKLENATQVDVALPHHVKAIALNWQDKGKEAVAAIDESIRLSSPQNRPYQRLMRARYVAKTGDYQEAAKLVKAELAGGNTNTWDAALAYALCVKAAKDDEKVKEEYAKEAVALLRKTLDAKKFNTPWKTDTDLNPIRERADFKAVMAEFEKLTAPKPPEK